MKKMWRHKRWGSVMALFCCLCLFLAACGEGEPVEETTSKAERAASVNNGTLNEDSAAVSVGKTTVPYKEYKAYYYFMESQYADILSKDIWTYKGALDGGKTIRQEAVEDVLRLIIQVKVITKAAAVQGVKLAADEKEEADYNAKKFCEGLSDQIKQANNITQPLLTQIFEENKLAEKMYRVIIGKVDVNVTAEQARAAKVQLLFLKTEGQDKAKVKQKAEELHQKAVSGPGSFYKLAKENTQGSQVETIVGQMDTRKTLAGTVLGMKKYQVSGVVEEKDGYYIAYCLCPPGKKINEEYRNQVVAERQVQGFQKAYKEWSEQYEVKVSKSLLAE